jgi:hypothetical protein
MLDLFVRIMMRGVAIQVQKVKFYRGIYSKLP